MVNIIHDLLPAPQSLIPLLLPSAPFFHIQLLLADGHELDSVAVNLIFVDQISGLDHG